MHGEGHGAVSAAQAELQVMGMVPEEKSAKGRAQRAEPIAEALALGQKEISVAEFFERNRQILGFDSPTKALITAIKEAVDNALDACEEASILPDLDVQVHKTEHEDELRIVVEDNGPGIVKRQMPNIFARLLYGSRFHAIRQSRGQQGIGISAVVLYGQLTTGSHALVISKIGPGHPAVRMEIALDTKKNLPEVLSTEAEHWDKDHGTRVEVVIKARYQGGRQSAFEYLRSTSIVNPHARIRFTDPNGQVTLFERATDEVPAKTVEIKPHPLGTELGTLLKMLKGSGQRKVSAFLTQEFSSVSSDTAKRILESAKVENHDPKDVDREEARRLHEAFSKVKILAPPTDCLSPIGEQLVRRGLKKETEDVSPEYIITVTRAPAVWGGHPFQVEVGIVYGGSLPADDQVRILRFANRVPLLYQGGGCASTVAVQDVDWRRYGLEQRGGQGMPSGPAIVLVHVASTKVPFTSEAKEAVAPIDEIHREIKLALQEAARGLGRHLAKKAKRAKVSEKFTLVNKILPELARKSAKMLGKPEPDLAPIVCKIMDVVWVEDPVVEYEKLEGQTLAASTPKQTEPAKEPPKEEARKGKTLEAFAPEPASVTLAEAKPRQAFLGKAKITLTNYMLGSKKFRFFVVMPENAVFVEADPKPAQVAKRVVAWDVPALKPTEKLTLSYQVGGVDKGGLDDAEAYVSGINEIHVVGADPWHGGE
ncbi:MAG: DNA topoisomerase VI subunit B [Thermoplasmatota archaeon]